MIKFSIVMPTYDQAGFIRCALESILTQKGDFLTELIVMDGGSNDGTQEILKEYDTKLIGDSRIAFIWRSGKDRGQSDALNQGFHLATGDILGYLNSDDYYLPDAFAIVAKAMQSEDTNWLYGLCQIVDEHGKPMRGLIERYRNFMGARYSFPKLLILNFIAQPATFWKRKLYTEFGEFKEDEHLVMDYEYWCNFGSRYSPTSLPSFLAAFRMHSQSKSVQNPAQQFQEKQKIAARFTNSRMLLRMAKLHDWLTLFVYGVISH